MSDATATNKARSRAVSSGPGSGEARDRSKKLTSARVERPVVARPGHSPPSHALITTPARNSGTGASLTTGASASAIPRDVPVATSVTSKPRSMSPSAPAPRWSRGRVTNDLNIGQAYAYALEYDHRGAKALGPDVPRVAADSPLRGECRKVSVL